MITRLIERLNAHAEVAQWTVLHKQTREWQHYVIRQSPEATREVTNEQYVVELFHRHPGPDGAEAMGVALITLTAADAEQIDAKIADGLLIASLTNNRPWSLPQTAEFPDVPLADEASLQDPYGAIDRFSAEMLAAIEQEAHIRLSAAEFYLEELTTKIYNSAGVRGEQRATEFTLEFVLLANNGTAPETEHYVMEKRRRIGDLNAADLIAENAGYARDSIVAELPETRQGPVVIDNAALPELFSPFDIRCGGQAKYQKMSQMNVGESVLGAYEMTGEPLHVSYSSALPYGVHSYSFSDDGLPGQETRVVEDSVLKAFMTSQRYADYLGVEATGEIGNLIIGCGTTPEAELLQGPIFHVVAFSAMMPSVFTGDFAAEIKLGYYIDEAGHRTPVKGGSLTGNLFQALADARYAQETVFTGTFQGPKSIRFNRNVTLAGK